MKKLFIILTAFICLVTHAQQHKTYRNDILVCGQIPYSVNYYYAGVGEDFMAAHGLQPGDTVAIKQGLNGEDTLYNIDLGNASLHDLVFINDSTNTKQIKIGWFGLGNNAYNIKFLGSGVKGMKYGFKFFDKLHFGLSWECVGDNEAAYFEIDSCLIGAQLITRSDHIYPLNYQCLHFHDILIQNTFNEACYFGYVHLSPIMMDLNIHDITIRNAGRDGIQTRNTNSVRIYDCDIDGVGLTREWGQNHGIDFGSCKDSGIVRNVIAKNISGNGIWSDGFGNFLFQNNNIQSEGESIFIRAYNPDAPNFGDDQNIGYETTVVKCNTFRSGKGVTTQLLTDTASHKPVTFIATDNNCDGLFYIPKDVFFTSINNNTSASCKQIVILPIDTTTYKPPAIQNYYDVQVFDFMGNHLKSLDRKNITQKEFTAVLPKHKYFILKFYNNKEFFTQKIFKQ